MATEIISTNQGNVAEHTHQVADENFALICFGSSRNSDLLLLGRLHRLLDTTDRGRFASLSSTTRVATAVLAAVLHDDVERLIKFGTHVDGVIFAGDRFSVVEGMKLTQSSTMLQLQMVGRQIK